MALALSAHTSRVKPTVHSVGECWHSELGKDTLRRYLVSAGTPVHYYYYYALQGGPVPRRLVHWHVAEMQPPMVDKLDKLLALSRSVGVQEGAVNQYSQQLLEVVLQARDLSLISRAPEAATVKAIGTEPRLRNHMWRAHAFVCTRQLHQGGCLTHVVMLLAGTLWRPSHILLCTADAGGSGYRPYNSLRCYGIHPH